MLSSLLAYSENHISKRIPGCNSMIHPSWKNRRKSSL